MRRAANLTKCETDILTQAPKRPKETSDSREITVEFTLSMDKGAFEAIQAATAKLRPTPTNRRQQ